VFSGVPVAADDSFVRPAAGGGGLGDPLERDLGRVLDDVIDGYVSAERAARDYGVVIEPVDREIDEWRIDEPATTALRADIRSKRNGWLSEDPEHVAARLRAGALRVEDVVRWHGVICDWDTGTVLPRSTEQFRAAMRMRGAGAEPPRGEAGASS
jgi:N-methylhydantoinase B